MCELREFPSSRWFPIAVCNIHVFGASCVQLIIPAESAHDTVAALGEVGLLQFKDLNQDKSAFQRTYANQVCAIACWLALSTRGFAAHTCACVRVAPQHGTIERECCRSHTTLAM